MRLVGFIIIFVALSLTGSAQSFLAAKTFVKDNQVRIRWAPSDYKTLMICKEKGYVIRRIQWNREEPPDSGTFRNSEFVNYVSSLPQNAWKDIIERNSESAFLYNVLFKQAAAKENEMFFGMALLACDFDIELASAAGLYWEDKTTKGSSYAYLITPADKKAQKEVKPAIIVTDASRNNVLHTIDSVKASIHRKTITLFWNINSLKADYPGYFIERSEDGRGFIPLNKKPHILITTQYEKTKTEIAFDDTSAAYDKTYFYRVRGLGFFGLYGDYSKPVKVKLVKPLEGYALIDSTQLVKDSCFKIFWHAPEQVNANELSGYAIYRAKADNGPYVRINKKLVNDYTFVDERPYKSTYYKLVTYNTAGDSIASAPYMCLIPDKQPPKTPLGLWGKIDSTGKVWLSWRANKEKDLKGYRIFRNNAPDEEPVEITRTIVKDTMLLDSVDINTLTEHVFYYITAADEVYNNSPYSAPVKLKRPDKIKPVGVVFKELYHNDSTLIIKWIPSTSSDVLKYELWRKFNGNFEKVKQWNKTDTITYYLDTKLEYATYYQYKIVVFDDDGNVSEEISPVHYYDSRFRRPVTKVDYTVDREQKNITLRWDYPEKGVYSYVLYKSKKGEPLKAVRTFKPQINSYQDKELYIGNIYVYKIKANFNSGAESPLSRDIEIVY